MEIQPDLSLCLLLRPGHGAGLSGFLESLYTHADPVSFEVIVVANAGDGQGLSELEREFPDITILENPDPDPAPKAINHALRLARGRYLSLWDDALRFRAGSLLTLLTFLEETPEAGIVAPRIVAANGLVVPSVRTAPGLATLCLLHTPLRHVLPPGRHLARHVLSEQDHLQSFEAEWLLASALVLRREALEEIGLLDEGFAGFYADADYCLRARRAGWRLYYLAGAVVSSTRQSLAPWPEAGVDPARILGDCTRFLLKKWLRPARLPGA
ncbi:glycosyltransferase [Thiovibrio sp. JS02]